MEKMARKQLFKNLLGVFLVVLCLVKWSTCQQGRCHPDRSAVMAEGIQDPDEEVPNEPWGDLPRVDLSGQEVSWFQSLGEGSTSSFSGRGFQRKSQYTVLRKELRQVTKEERGRLQRALEGLRGTIVDTETNRTEFEVLIAYHRYSMAPAAHRGAAFLPWHREYLWRFERGLQRHEPKASLPYWDSSLDKLLPTSQDSIMFTQHLVGPDNGEVTSGIPANWSTNEGCNGWLGATLKRNAGSRGFYDLFDDQRVDDVMSESSYIGISCSGCCFERFHDGVHVYVSGHMGSVECAPNDPLFWMHHNFIDYLWEEFRNDHQTTDPEMDYPVDPQGFGGIGGNGHGPYKPMEPWPMQYNIQGTGNHYTNYYYEYKPRPHDCQRSNDCGSNYLWCNSGRCTSKVRPGGSCTGLPDEACHGHAYFCDGSTCRKNRND